jgi:DNA-binding response OmpR family regulator
MKLLRALLDGNGNVVTNEDLIKAVWGSNIGRVPSLYAYIRRLRQQIEITPSLPELIITHASVGYCYILKP